MIDIQIKDGYIYYNGTYVTTTFDRGIIREDGNGKPKICTGYYCRAYKSVEYIENDDYFDDFTIANGYEIIGKNNSDIYNAIVAYLE